MSAPQDSSLARTLKAGNNASGTEHSSPKSSAHSLAQLDLIIPVGPGDLEWQPLLKQLLELAQAWQIYMVFCREADRELAQGSALPFEVQLLLAPPGRAAQQNYAAQHSSRPWICFLHADSSVNGEFSAALARIAQTEKAALWFFDLAFHEGPGWLWLNRIGVWLRSRWFKLAFGDQALTLRRTDFERLGGFSDALVFAEDHALVFGAQRAGLALLPAGAQVTTSGRRYTQCGWLRTTLRHLRLSWQHEQKLRAANRTASRNS